ncbi:rhodanese-related sulfurtransferase [Nostoc sp. MBR 210]|uniref:Rhodanese-related sulfurtransferase n=1 Tax=Nostoc spongiaeforme FACHB-130 TaxID=1357510 RepID=A0ABR8FX13_9NOSO|nr:rhodanese-like domain-containing protein [Nostoc spongiaeforme]MBD2594659.1 rhodanese-related sulfurtransferase [Nostoc spongiaeforme FACHB-130]OCQ97360.1 rhodanese-related sulfurtransferase [Nostoc sp. MBR 210]
MTDKSFGQPMMQISVEELAERLATGDGNIQLVDVREPQELAIASLPGFVNLPLSEYADWNEKIFTMLNPEAETFVLCHHGVRSAQMCQWLIAQGFTNVKNITGGIAAYSQLVDPAIPQY